MFTGKNKGETNKADILVGVYWKPENQDEKADKILYKQLGKVSPFIPLVHEREFNLPGV